MLRHSTIGLLLGLALLIAEPAYAYYGHHYGHHSSHHYGRHGYSFGHRGYRHQRHRYYGGHYGQRSGHHGNGLLNGFLGLFGHQGFDDRSRTQHDDSKPRTDTRALEYDSGSSAPADTSHNAPNHSSKGQGWEELANGSYSAARSIFAADVQRHPERGTPKVGYALAAAAGGDLERGSWAMRRAFRIDPSSIKYAEVDDRLRSQIGLLLDRFLARRGENRDAAFMVAALYYLLGDADSARGAMDWAVQHGDSSLSLQNLGKLIMVLNRQT